MNKRDVCKAMRLDELGSYDCALPQPWLDAAADKLSPYAETRDMVYRTLLGGLVWFYPKEPGYLFGYPFPITVEAAEYITILNSQKE